MTDGPSPETGETLEMPSLPHRRRMAAIVGAVVLAGAGFGVGWVTGHRGTGGAVGTTAVAAAGATSPGWDVVTERQTADGTLIRVYEHKNPPVVYPDGWSPPPGCTAIGSMQADLSDAKAVGIADAGVFDPAGPLAVIGTGVWGTTEGPFPYCRATRTLAGWRHLVRATTDLHSDCLVCQLQVCGHN